MRRIRFEVLPDRAGGWSMTRDRVVQGVCGTQAKAVAYAVDRARAARRRGHLAGLVIKGRDGRIREERTYGREPAKGEGK